MNMRKSNLLLVLTAVLVASTSANVLAKELTWTGCGITKKAFMAEMVKAYEAKTGIHVELSGGGATKGIRAVSAGTADMGGTCRHWLKDVSDSVHAEEKDVELVTVAWDAIVVVAHPDNPVSDISLDDLKKVYDGEVTNWKDLGGPDKRIALVVRDGKSSGVGHMFRRLVFSDPDYAFKARALKVKSSGPLEKKVEKMTMAMAVDGISSAKKRDLKILSVNGVAPTKENISSGKYPLFRPLYLAVNAKSASAEARKFVDFVLSPEGQKIVAEQGTVNLEEGAALKAMWDAKKANLGA